MNKDLQFMTMLETLKKNDIPFGMPSNRKN